MSRNANPGELRTPVRFVTVTRTQDGESYYTESETVALETVAKWVNVHGSEAFSDDMVKLSEPATLTCSPVFPKYRFSIDDPFHLPFMFS